MKYRKLRIAWSVTWGVVAVLLCVLWVRSRYRTDLFVGPWYTGGSFNFASIQGEVGLCILPSANLSFGRMNNVPSDVLFAHPQYCSRLGFRYSNNSIRQKIIVPYWFVLAITSCLIFMPWLRFRFSLRTLLIATTLLAVVLGLFAWFK